MQIIKEYVAEKKERLKGECAKIAKSLIIIQVGHVPASDVYVKNKIKDAEELGLDCVLHNVDEGVAEEELLRLIDAYNGDPDVGGLLVQLPLPKHISEQKVKLVIAPEKDVDGFHPLSETAPATPLGVYNYLKDQGFVFEGKNAVVVGRSDIVGKPMAALLLGDNMNVTVLHSHTSDEDKRFYLSHADLIVVATGHIDTVTSNYILKKTATVIDVGINRGEDGKLIGDCERGLDVAFQSPVPGGVGLLTRLSVIDNFISLNR